MASEKKKRRIWKTFYFESGRDYHEIESVWASWPRSRKKHRMFFEGGGVIQTNVPLVELRDIFRAAEAKWVDYTSDRAMMPDTSERDVVKEARAFIEKIGNCGLYPDEAQRHIAALCDEIERLREENRQLYKQAYSED